LIKLYTFYSHEWEKAIISIISLSPSLSLSLTLTHKAKPTSASPLRNYLRHVLPYTAAHKATWSSTSRRQHHTQQSPWTVIHFVSLVQGPIKATMAPETPLLLVVIPARRHTPLPHWQSPKPSSIMLSLF